MRTTLSLDDDVLTIARERALRENLSIGDAVSRYVREGLQAGVAARVAPASLRSKYSVLPARNEVITSDHVRRLMEQEGI